MTATQQTPPSGPPSSATPSAIGLAPATANAITAPPASTLAAPASPPHDMLSPSRSPSSPSIPAKRPLPTDDDDPSSTITVAPQPQSPSTAAPQEAPTGAQSSGGAPRSSNHAAPPTKKVLERNQACLGCRQRKRKCDGGKPSCGACERLERGCVYTHNPVTKIHSSSHYPRAPANGSHAHSHSHRKSPSARAISSATPPSHGAPAGRGVTPPGPSVSVPHASRTSSNAAFTAINSHSDPLRGSLLSPTPHHGANGTHERRNFTSSYPRSYSPASGLENGDSSYFTTRFFQMGPFAELGPIDFPRSGDINLVDDKPADKPVPSLDRNDLPSPALMKELFDLFFEKVHVLLPCLYRKRTIESLQSGGDLSRANPLTYAILSLAGYLHSDAGVKAASETWARRARTAFDEAIALGKYSLLVVQGGVYLSLRMFGLGRVSELWAFIGTLWRICLPLGLNALDKEGAFQGWLPQPKSEQEIEERRRTMWSIYIIDRVMTACIPWPMCISDSEFCVNFPQAEEMFQSGSIETAERMIVDPFTSSLESLVPRRGGGAHAASELDSYQYLCKLSVLVSRINAHNHSLSDPTPSEFDMLENALARFQLALPKRVRSLAGVPRDEIPAAVLTNALLSASSIWLHQARARPQPSSSPDNDAFEKCVVSVQSILRSIRTAISSPDNETSLGNPLLGPPLWVAARILCVHYLGERLQKEQETPEARKAHSDVDTLIGVFDRMGETWPQLANRYRTLINSDMARDPNEVVRIGGTAGGHLDDRGVSGYAEQ